LSATRSRLLFALCSGLSLPLGS